MITYSVMHSEPAAARSITRSVHALLLRLILLTGALVALSAFAWSDTIPVRFQEGLLHGFLTLHTPKGAALADGDLLQTVEGERVTARLVYHFKDGSLFDDTTVFSQKGRFRLISDHLIQRGPAFEHAMDIRIDAASGAVIVQYAEGAETKTLREQLALPADLANGMVPTLIKNISPAGGVIKVSYLVATPKPRLVKLAIRPMGKESFSTGKEERQALHYAVHVEIGGIAGMLASILGKQPPDTQVWIVGGAAPTFAKSEGLLSIGGPVVRTELASPKWGQDGNKQ